MTIQRRKTLLAKAARILRTVQESNAETVRRSTSWEPPPALDSPRTVASIFRAMEILRREWEAPYDPEAIRALDPATARSFESLRSQSRRIVRELNAMLEETGLSDLRFAVQGRFPTEWTDRVNT
jgi:hypothetical protein